MDLFTDTASQSLPFELPSGLGFSYLFCPEKKVFTVKIPDGDLLYIENLYEGDSPDRFMGYFLENDRFDGLSVDWSNINPDEFSRVMFRHIAWKQDKINLFGKQIPLPRLTSWYGDEGMSYNYSGINSNPNSWNPGLSKIREKLEAIAGTQFNSVLLNWYRGGEDYINWHADDEEELGPNPTIASINFGATRDFLIRRIDDPSLKFSVPLSNGSLLIMRGTMQHYWQHSVPKRKKVKNSRINLTFRYITT